MPRYLIGEKLAAELAKRFTYHTPREDQPERYQILRGEALGLARLICELCPDSRERATALTNLEQAIFWANAGIARNEPAENATASGQVAQVSISVNGRGHEFAKLSMSYDDLVALAGLTPGRAYSAMYSHGLHDAQGILHRGESVLAVNGMIFNIADTSNA